MAKKPVDRYDIAIVGAGVIGSVLANLLSRAGFSIALIEKNPVDQNQHVQAIEQRYLGLSRSTGMVLQGIGLWQAIDQYATELKRVHLSSQGWFGTVMFDAADEGIERLGDMVAYRDLQRITRQALLQNPAVDWFNPARLLAVKMDAEQALLQLQLGERTLGITADLVVGADGTDSALRHHLQIGARHHSYGQSALTVNIEANVRESDLAFERFFDGGVMALLPRRGGYALVICAFDEQVAKWFALSEPKFIDFIHSVMRGYIGEISAISKRHCVALELKQTLESVRPRLVLVGNAAHTIHPVAAQGFNLGIRDVAALTEVLGDARDRGLDLGQYQMLLDYANWRYRDGQVMSVLTDGLARFFTNPKPPVALVRQQLLWGLRYSHLARGVFARALSGRLGRQAALVRGLF